MIKILIIQEASRHSGNRLYRECLCVQRALCRKGVESVIYGPGHPEYHKPLDVVADGCNVILFLENYDDTGWTPILKDINVLKIFWSIDGHVAERRHIDLCRQNGFDVVLNACARCVDVMREYADSSLWFPNCYPQDLFDAIEPQDRFVDFGYIGSRGNIDRRFYLTQLQEHGGLSVYTDIMGDAMVRRLKSFRISFNRNVSHDVNFRTFESMAAGAVLVTNETPGLHSIIEHCEVYASVDDCIGIVNDLLSDPEKIQTIAAAGEQCVRERHTYDVRMDELLTIIKEYA